MIDLGKIEVRSCSSGGACSETHMCVEILEFSDSVHITFCLRFAGLKELVGLLDRGERLDLALKR